jgi:hypothetical protein
MTRGDVEVADEVNKAVITHGYRQTGGDGIWGRTEKAHSYLSDTWSATEVQSGAVHQHQANGITVSLIALRFQ